MEEENDEGFSDFQDMPSVMAIAEIGVRSLSLCLACSFAERLTALTQNP